MANAIANESIGNTTNRDEWQDVEVRLNSPMLIASQQLLAHIY